MKDALVIKTNLLLKPDVLDRYQKMFAEQLKTGVVVIPGYFEAELVNVPTDVEVILEAPDDTFLDKSLHMNGESHGAENL